jgi:DNA-binding ferritin-like protein
MIIEDSEKNDILKHIQNGGDCLVDAQGFMQGLSSLYQILHWTAKGQVGYSDHLLFEKLYDKFPGEQDSMAEKIIGSFPNTEINAYKILQVATSLISRWEKVAECDYCKAKVAERDFLAKLENCVFTLKNEDTYTLGLEDFLPSIASSHEENVYLLERNCTCQIGK